VAPPGNSRVVASFVASIRLSAATPSQERGAAEWYSGGLIEHVLKYTADH